VGGKEEEEEEWRTSWETDRDPSYGRPKPKTAGSIFHNNPESEGGTHGTGKRHDDVLPLHKGERNGRTIDAERLESPEERFFGLQEENDGIGNGDESVPEIGDGGNGKTEKTEALIDGEEGKADGEQGVVERVVVIGNANETASFGVRKRKTDVQHGESWGRSEHHKDVQLFTKQASDRRSRREETPRTAKNKCPWK
jgi:hypothetical protein